MFKELIAFGMATATACVALPAIAQQANTYAPDQETIVGGRDVSLPSKPVTPWSYALPMVIEIVQDSSITTNTPITDATGNDVMVWGEAIRDCLAQAPEMMRETKGGDQPFVTSNVPGTINLNANSVSVCDL